jgi:hypothetical protein
LDRLRGCRQRRGFAVEREKRRLPGVCRLARNILMSDAYLYPGLRGVAGSRAVTAMEAGTPQSGDTGEAVQFAVVRLALEVQFAERYIEREGPPVERIDFEITPAEGELVAKGGQQQQEE